MWVCMARSTGMPSTVSGNCRATSSHRMGGPPAFLEQHVTQALAPAVEPYLRRRDRDPEILGDGLVRQAVHVLEYHDAPQLGWQRGDGARQLLEPDGRLDRRLRLRLEGGVDRLLDVLEGLGPAPAPLLHERGGGVGRDAVHPGGELRVAAEALDALPGPEIGLLDHVACVLRVGRHPHCDGAVVDVGAPHKSVERRSVAGSRGIDQPVDLGPQLCGWIRGHSDPCRRCRVTRPGYRVSLWSVWRRSQRQYFFISMRSRSLVRFFIVM